MSLRKIGLSVFVSLGLGWVGCGFLWANTAVLYVGREWCAAGDALEMVWPQAIPTGMAAKIYDEPDFDEADAALKAFRLEVDRYPAVAVFDDFGKCMGLMQGLPRSMSASALGRVLQGYADRAMKVQELLESGRTDDVLMLLAPELEVKRLKMIYPEAWKAFEADKGPKYQALTFNPSQETYAVQKFALAKDYAGGEAFLAQLTARLAGAQLSMNQRQGLKLLRFVLYKNSVAHRAEAVKILREVAAMDPTTHFGIGAVGYLAMWKEGPEVKYPQAPRLEKQRVGATVAELKSMPTGIFEQSELARYAVMMIGRAALNDELKQQGGGAFLKQFFTPNYLEAFFTSGPFKDSAAECFERLASIAFSGAPQSDEEWRWAIALALNASEGSLENALGLMAAFRQLKAEGLLHKRFGELTVRQLRFVFTPKQLSPDAVLWIAHQHCVPWKKYGGVCWYAPYRLENFFGDSIHGPDYYKPWNHVYTWQEATRKVGGVCGSLSYYGSVASKAHGIPSTPGGQPGHCAYMSYNGRDRWEIHYNVEPYTGMHYWLWEPRFPYCDLMETMFTDAGYLDSMKQLRGIALDRHSLNPKPLLSQMRFDAYHWSGRFLPNFSMLTQPLVELDNVKDFDIDLCPEKDHVAMRWRGVLSIMEPQPQKLSIRFMSDDGGRLLIDGDVVVDHDGPHGMEPKFTVKELFPGEHEIEVQYSNIGGARGLNVKWVAQEPYSKQIAMRYEKACATSPTNYSAWEAFAKWLVIGTDVPMATWHRWGEGLARGLADHPAPAWTLINRYLLPRVLAQEGSDALLQTLVKLHQILRQPDVKTAEFFDFGELLKEHAKLLGNDQARCFELFKVVLETQFGTKNAFGVAMRWGSARFIKDEAYSSKFTAELSALIARHGEKNEGLKGFLTDTIYEASHAENNKIFHLLCDLQAELEPGYLVTKRQEQPIDFTKAPLLSDKGLLKLSTTSGWDSPLAYRCVIDRGVNSIHNFHTGKEESPWAMVILPGMAEVSAVYLENVHSQNDSRLVPIVLWLSEDGKHWKQVWRDTQVKGEWKITLPEPIRARYVKVGREPNVRIDFFHLKKFMVFGKQLY